MRAGQGLVFRTALNVLVAIYGGGQDTNNQNFHGYLQRIGPPLQELALILAKL